MVKTIDPMDILVEVILDDLLYQMKGEMTKEAC